MEGKCYPSYCDWFGCSDLELVKNFVDEGFAYGLSEITISKYLYQLKIIRSLSDVDFCDWNANDAKSVLAKINQMNYSDWSKYSFRKTMRKFFQVLKSPEIVGWIRLEPGKIRKKYEILTKDEIERMIAKAKPLRDKAFIGVLWDSGCRISEIANLKTNDLSWDEYGCVINVSGKTGQRMIRIIEHSAYLEMYLKHRSLDSEWVWLTEDNFSRGHKMSIKALREILKRAGRRAEITKPTYPHNFRHSIATEYSHFLTENMMRIFFGWSRNSRMPSLYSHLSMRDVDSRMIEVFYPKQEITNERKVHNLKGFF